MNEKEPQILEQSDSNKINPSDTILKESKTLTFRDTEKAICEKCGVTNHQEKAEAESINIIVFSDETETKSFCNDCLATLKVK
ncbi:hypothetical protein [endosymbiont GvMRE of Glomus versiforme]|uniref:hypothetical protein n=1 Tax=endosymbiont GvMRE of Glomus versiforme TaxID=2039283 RepID=UPI000ED00087|nr:hypothetical protein [endosymbiont GvMRE of Glomus versiforme]RHZ36868.1 hypothetical protein GvMRE_I2g56 [endosymbiont GvMRE of Glomus versiforme]